MKDKTRVHIDFSGKWAAVAPALAGFGFFLYCVYYFGITNIIDCNILEILFQMLLPMVLLAAFTVLWQMKRYDAFHVYTLMGGLYCVAMFFRTFSYSSVIVLILEGILYSAAAIVCFLVVSGKTKKFQSITKLISVALAFRLLVVLLQYVLTLSLFSLVREVAALCGLAVFATMIKCIKEVK